MRIWRTDIDDEIDVPILTPENESNTCAEYIRGYRSGPKGTRIESKFWRDEWIEHKSLSVRIRGDADPNLPSFIIDNDGSKMPSSELKNEDIGRWLWFRNEVTNELLINEKHFSLKWLTEDTGIIISPSNYSIHFGINSSDLITVYAADIARLPSWEQHIWAAFNVSPEGGLSKELSSGQILAEPAKTEAPENLLFKNIEILEKIFIDYYNTKLFLRTINKESLKTISRLTCHNKQSLFKLAKEIIRIFSDRLNIKELRKLSILDDEVKNNLGSNKLLESILAGHIKDKEEAHKIFTIIFMTYELRLADAHPVESNISEILRTANIDSSLSFIRQGKQLISHFSNSIHKMGTLFSR